MSAVSYLFLEPPGKMKVINRFSSKTTKRAPAWVCSVSTSGYIFANTLDMLIFSSPIDSFS